MFIPLLFDTIDVRSDVFRRLDAPVPRVELSNIIIWLLCCSENVMYVFKNNCASICTDIAIANREAFCE